jgi:RNA polymerase sigma-70 factor, Bacteroides expansion family 1
VELNDNQLLETLKAGDITAFEMLFRSYYQPLCNYAYTFVQDRDEAEEIVQTTFLAVWERKEALEIRTAVKPYLYAMVRNACLNVLKHEKVKKQHAVVQMAVGERSVESVARTVMASELETKIYEAMDTLPEQCRLVFKLSRFEELKYSEIAEQLNISVKTVENHMGKALRIMREQLRDYLPLLIVIMNGFLN